jgi:predicted nucleic acid-binding protein
VETLQDRLSGHTRLGLDTPVFIYHLEQHPRYSALTRVLLSEIESGQRTACTSVVTLMELTVRPWQLDRPDVVRSYETALARFPNLALADVTRDIARQAAQLRAAYRLRPADALQAATALVCGATLFVTNERTLGRLEPAIAILVLEDVTL